MNAVRKFLTRIKSVGSRRAGVVKTVSMGRERRFEAYDVGADTYVFEQGVAQHLAERPSVLVVAKRDLCRSGRGRVFTMTTGNHAVAAFPLLDGRFWGFSRLPSERRSEVLTRAILCANVVGATIEVSQRDVPTETLVAGDAWLTGAAGFSIRDIVMCDRNEHTLEHYRGLGQEWRVKPLAWTEAEMRAALAASRKRMSTDITYFHSARGVHFLSFAEFRRFSTFAQTDPVLFLAGLKELVGVFEGNRTSFTRMPKYRGHHEIEFFGIRRGLAAEKLLPEIEKLMEAVALGRLGQLGVIQRAEEIVALYASLLTRPELADETAKIFTETMYMHITGEVYAIVGEGMTPAFDDRRTALPGATFEDGNPVLHPGADARTERLFANLCALMSKDEVIEYANVYELRADDDVTALGKGATREIVYKTNRRPLENSLVEKRLSRSGGGYGGYIISRIGALRGLGVQLSDYYQLLKRSSNKGAGRHDYYIRRRCEGEPMDGIPANYFRSLEDPSVEAREVVLGLATLMGDAAAQNMAMKKYEPKSQSPLYGIGKEIYALEYDIVREQIVPKKVSTCSIRGSFGWPSLDYTDENLNRLANFYMTHFAHALKIYQRKHASFTMEEIAERFMGGFEYRTRELAWNLSVMRDRFEAFNPPVPASYGFAEKWRFVMWSLERQDRRLPSLRRLFFEKVALIQKDADPLPFEEEIERIELE